VLTCPPMVKEPPATSGTLDKLIPFKSNQLATGATDPLTFQPVNVCVSPFEFSVIVGIPPKVAVTAPTVLSTTGFTIVSVVNAGITLVVTKLPPSLPKTSVDTVPVGKPDMT